MAFRSDIYAVVLGTLQSGPLHGYEIVRRIREAGIAAKMSEGQIYPYLHKLEAEGLVTAEWQTDTGNAPRRIYQLTPTGLQELERKRRDFKKFVAGVGLLLSADAVKEVGNV